MINLRRTGRSIFNRIGYDIVSRNPECGFKVVSTDLPKDMSESDTLIWSRVTNFTMTPVARVISLLNAIDYLQQRRIEGAIVECGVGHGGSMMAAALRLIELGDLEREIHLYDLFGGWPDPSDFDGARAHQVSFSVNSGTWDIAGTESEIVERMLGTGYPAKKIITHKGPVESTLVEPGCGDIALLRLDTDMYESHKVELLKLYPKLQPGGILILDDYGDERWPGARRATDEYFSEADCVPFLSRVDKNCRIAVKPW